MENPKTQDDTRRDLNFSIKDILLIIWGNKYKTALGVAPALAISVLLCIKIPNQYISTSVLMPTKSENNISSQILNKFSGIASLAGIQIDSNNSDKTSLAIETLKSIKFLSAFARSRDLTIPIVAASSWDRKENKWIIDQDIYNHETGEWTLDTESGSKTGPSDWMIHKHLSENLLIEVNEKTGTITIGFKLMSPIAARDWTNWIIHDLNQELKTRDINDAKSSIQYLEDQIRKTSVSEMKEIFYQIIAEQVKIMMLAEAQGEYALRVIDPAFTPDKKSSPIRSLILLFGLIIGIVISSSFTVMRYTTKEKANGY